MRLRWRRFAGVKACSHGRSPRHARRRFDWAAPVIFRARSFLIAVSHGTAEAIEINDESAVGEGFGIEFLVDVLNLCYYILIFHFS